MALKYKYAACHDSSAVEQDTPVNATVTEGLLQLLAAIVGKVHISHLPILTSGSRQCAVHSVTSLFTINRCCLLQKETRASTLKAHQTYAFIFFSEEP